MAVMVQRFNGDKAMKRIAVLSCAMSIMLMTMAPVASGWFDETHLAIAKAAGYQKWYNAAAADVSRIKLGKKEGGNHYHNSPRDVEITPEMVLEQAARYDRYDANGHLYGAIIASYRAYQTAKTQGKYAENHMAYLIHYIGDLSMPLHHTMHNDFNKRNHMANDGIIDDEVMSHLDHIKIYPITIRSENDLAREVARIANLSKKLGQRMEDENRLMTREEAYRQISHSASLLKAILEAMNLKWKVKSLK
jgi:hypothetical protein